MNWLKKKAKAALEVCRRRGWKRSWVEAGCYLHLESSELIEALRGKGGSSAEAEAADVLFVLLSMLEANGVDFDAVELVLDGLIVQGGASSAGAEPGHVDRRPPEPRGVFYPVGRETRKPG